MTKSNVVSNVISLDERRRRRAKPDVFDGGTIDGIPLAEYQEYIRDKFDNPEMTHYTFNEWKYSKKESTE